MSEFGFVFDQGKLEESLARLKSEVDRINVNARTFGYQSTLERLEFFEEQRRQEQWATDPMGLMGWFSLNQWRWWMADRLSDAADALNALAEWISPE